MDLEGAAGDAAREINTRIKMRYYQSLVFKWLDSFPKPEGVPDWPEVMPEPTLDELNEQIEAGIMCVGTPEECAEVTQQYADAGADQLVVSPMTTTMPYETALDTMKLYGEKVIPQFDIDPTFRSDRNREKALG